MQALAWLAVWPQQAKRWGRFNEGTSQQLLPLSRPPPMINFGGKLEESTGRRHFGALIGRKVFLVQRLTPWEHLLVGAGMR